jgi:hypothetical protein
LHQNLRRIDCAKRQNHLHTTTNLFCFSFVMDFHSGGSLSVEDHPSDKRFGEDGQVGTIHVWKDVRSEHGLSFAISCSNVRDRSTPIGFHHAAIRIFESRNSN